MISSQFDLHRFRPLWLLAFFSILATTAVAQQTSEWIVVDGKHEGRFNSNPTMVAAAGRGDYIVMTREDITIGPYTIRRTEDGGSSWRIVRADSGQGWRITAIAHPAPNAILAIGDTARKGFILRSLDGGATWDRQDPADSFSPISLTMSDATHGAIVSAKYSAATGNQYRLRVTSDGGTTWISRPLPFDSSSYVGGVYSRAAGSYLVNDYNPATKKGSAHLTADGGLTWETVPLSPDIRAIDFANEMLGIGVGGIATGIGQTESDLIIRTTDGGRSWTTILDSAIDFRWGLNDISMADRDHGIAVGGYGKIYRTTDGGLTWRQEWPPSFTVAEYVNLVAVAFGAADEALAVTGNASYVLKYSGRQRLAAPRIVAPSTGLAELPLEVTISWTPIEGALWYDLQIGDTTYEYNFVDHAIFDEPFVDAVGLTATSRTVFLDPERRYEIRVRARNQSDTSDWSVRLSALSRTSGQTLSAPGIILPLEGATNVPTPTHIEWTAVAGATGYDLLVADNPSFSGSSLVSLSGHPATSYDAALKPNTVYFAIVRARSATGVGNWSNVNEGKRSFTTGGASRVIDRRGPDAALLSIGPNPVTSGILPVMVERRSHGETTLLLSDTRGAVVATLFSANLPAGRTTIPLDLSAFASGAWFLRMIDEQGSVMEKIVKE